jgi:hypothetical protein
MKSINKIILTSAAFIGLTIGCKDEALDPYIKPEGNANGFGQFVSLSTGNSLPSPSAFYDQSAVDAQVFFDENDQSKGINYKLQWISIDNRVNIASIELYVEYNETYSDADRNPLLAKHGGESKGPSYPAGKFWKSVTPTGARVPVDITITPTDIYELFKDNTFDYDADGTQENIFSAAAAAITKTDRTNASKRLYSARTVTLPAGNVSLSADQFRIRWRLISDDGTGYGSWSASVCQETVGINCAGQWRVNKNVFNPRASYARETGAKTSIKDGDKTTITITYDRAIATAPTLSLTPAQGTLGTLTPVSGSTTKFTVEYTAPAGYTGSVAVGTSGAVSSGTAPLGGLTQVASSTTLNIDNTAPELVGAVSFSSARVGRGQATTVTVNFNEAMSAVAADAVKVSITGQQGLDDVAATNMTLAANGLSATYLYLWKDSSEPFDNTQGAVTVVISGGKDIAGNAFAGTSGTFTNDVGSVVADAISTTGFISGVNVSPTASVAAGYDLGTQLKWSIAQTASANSSTAGTWFWVAVTAGTPAPAQATRAVTGLENPVYNGFNLSAISANVKAQGSTTASGVNFTPFTANGTFDIYMYFVSSTGNVSPNSKVLSDVVMN